MRRATLTTALGAVVLAAGWAPGSAQAASAQAASCAKLNEGQEVRLVGQVVEDRFSETYSSGGKPQTGDKDHTITRFDMGSLAMRATTCRFEGRWRVLDPVVLTPSYANVSSDGSVPLGATGWGLVPVRVGDRALTMRFVECHSSHVWGGVRGLLGIPLPGSYVVSLAQFVAGQVGGRVLPQDKTRCEEVVASKVRFRFDRRGTLSLKPVGGNQTSLVGDYGRLKIKKTLTVTARQG